MTCKQVVGQIEKVVSHRTMNLPIHQIESWYETPPMALFQSTYGRVIEVVRTDQLTNIIGITIERVPDSLETE